MNNNHESESVLKRVVRGGYGFLPYGLSIEASALPEAGRFDVIVTFLDDRKKRLSKRTIWRDYYLVLMKMISMKFWNVTITEGRIGS